MPSLAGIDPDGRREVRTVTDRCSSPAWTDGSEDQDHEQGAILGARSHNKTVRPRTHTEYRLRFWAWRPTRRTISPRFGTTQIVRRYLVLGRAARWAWEHSRPCGPDTWEPGGAMLGSTGLHAVPPPNRGGTADCARDQDEKELPCGDVWSGGGS
jgi:hypothetical protein